MSAKDKVRDRNVQGMFDRIAGRYDLLNRIISFRLDHGWRKKAVAAVLKNGSETLLDLGTGTGDLSFAAAKQMTSSGRVVGVDFSLQMLRQARTKQARRGGAARIDFVQASALAPPFNDAVFDGAMTAFVLRNVSDLQLFFTQCFRLLKPGGRLVALDMFPPKKGLFALIYAFYFHYFMPRLAGVLGRDRQAYGYLSESVRQFASPETVATLIEQSGFERVRFQRFLRGAVCLHVADKPRL